jgi:hypothetical protein
MLHVTTLFAVDWGSVISNATQIVTAAGVITGIILGVRKGTGLSNQVQEVHKAVNSTADAQNKRVDQLSQTITDEGGRLPDRAPGGPSD